MQVIAEIVNRRGRTLTTGGRFGSPSYENIILFAICPETREPRCTFAQNTAHQLKDMLLSPGDGASLEDERGKVLQVQADYISIDGQAFAVAEADRLRLAERIHQIERY